MSHPPAVRLPLEPLRTLLHSPSVSELADLTGLSYRQMQRWCREDALAVDHCETAAARLGLHPLLIWAEYGELSYDEEAMDRKRVRRDRQMRFRFR